MFVVTEFRRTRNPTGTVKNGFKFVTECGHGLHFLKDFFQVKKLRITATIYRSIKFETVATVYFQVEWVKRVNLLD